MIFTDENPRWQLKELLQQTQQSVKNYFEHYKLRQKTLENSSEYRIQTEVLLNISKEVLSNLEYVHGIILSYNAKPDTFPGLKDNDILESQLLLDEVVAKFTEIGVIFNFIRKSE